MASARAPLGSLLSWFSNTGAAKDEPRRAGSFHVWYQPENDAKWITPGVGIEVSPSGFIFAITAIIPAREFNMTIGLRNQRIPARVRVINSDKIAKSGRLWHRYSVEFVGIAADHWDLVVRYVNDTPEPEARPEIEYVDDAYRMLPMAVQQRIVDILVAEHKLDAPKRGQTPLMKLFYNGTAKNDVGAALHRFKVHSRIRVNDQIRPYDTSFIVGDDGSVKVADFKLGVGTP